MIYIDNSIDSLICLVIKNSDRRSLINDLKNKKKLETNIGLLNIEITSNESSIIDVSDLKEIKFKISEEGLNELIDSIEEHIEENTDLPLDHSFESLGYELIPECIEDVVFETSQ